MAAIARGRRRPGAVERRLIERVSTSRAVMSQQDKIWSRYSRDKVDIGETLARILRTLGKALPLDRPLRALSVGSSTEPQFRLLESSFRGGQRYTRAQRREITAHVYRNLFARRAALFQDQDHLVVYRGLRGRD